MAQLVLAPSKDHDISVSDLDSIFMMSLAVLAVCI